MELKRILARDTRSATEQAIALYGPDVLVISNHQVGGQTELVVALDIQPEPAPAASAPAAPALTQADFRQTFLQAQQEATAAPRQNDRVFAPEDLVPMAPAVPAPEFKLPAAPAQAAAPKATPEDARDLLRSREIVELVRDEIASLRREFRLSQQASAWHGGLQLHPALGPLVDALNDSQVPMGLRTLLLDALQDVTEPRQALALWRTQLEHSLARPQGALPSRGVHVLAGPSGGGKTMMCARLARHAASLHGAEGVAIISYRDQRAGAWSQTQMLGAQLGVDCFRANDEEALSLLLGELAQRPLVLVDTPGVQAHQRLAEIKGVAPQAAFHAVVPADASSVTLKRVFQEAPAPWSSLMPSKLDEASAPWALLQLISNNAITLSSASDGSRMTDLIHAFTIPQLVDLALAPLAGAVESPSAMQALPAGASTGFDAPATAFAGTHAQA